LLQTACGKDPISCSFANHLELITLAQPVTGSAYDDGWLGRFGALVGDDEEAMVDVDMVRSFR
jgi:hypothetical protein